MDKHTQESLDAIIKRLETKLEKLLGNRPDHLNEWGEEISPEAQRVEGEKYIRDIAYIQGEIYALKNVRL